MEECFKCYISGDKAMLYDAISDKGIVKICESCAYKEDIPIIKKPSGFPVTDTNVKPKKEQTVYERMSRISGYTEKIQENKELKEQDATLKDIADSNYQAKVQGAATRTDLIDNFHWIIMRHRRKKKFTQEQFAKAIAESEEAIKQAEQGVIVDDKLIDKIEQFLAINLRIEPKPRTQPQLQLQDDEPPTPESASEIEIVESTEQLSFDTQTAKTLTISDLQEMKKKRESEVFQLEQKPESEESKPEYEFNLEAEQEKGEEKPEFIEIEEVEEDKEEKEKDLTDKEIDDILYGRK